MMACQQVESESSRRRPRTSGERDNWQCQMGRLGAGGLVLVGFLDERMTAKRPLLTDTTRMEQAVTDLSQLSEVIAHATAPAFLLGAVAGFVSILIIRMNGIIDRLRSLNSIADDDARARLKADIPRLERRARLMNNAIYLAVGSGICTTVLVILAFASAFLGIRHEQVVGLLFVVALGLLGAALFTLAREVRIALNEFDHFP
jgi:hypothetical protein